MDLMSQKDGPQEERLPVRVLLQGVPCWGREGFSPPRKKCQDMRTAFCEETQDQRQSYYRAESLGAALVMMEMPLRRTKSFM